MAIIFEKNIVLTPENEKTNVSLDFFVEDDFERLEIFYSYSPKILDDREKSKALIEENIRRDAGENYVDYPSWEEFMPLKNLITLSLDSPSAYVGAAHRQADTQHHIISEGFASVGFEKNAIEKGKWILTLNLHAIVTENVECKVRIEGGTAQ